MLLCVAPLPEKTGSTETQLPLGSLHLPRQGRRWAEAEASGSEPLCSWHFRLESLIPTGLESRLETRVTLQGTF